MLYNLYFTRIVQATAALTKPKPIWRDNNITFGTKIKLMRSPYFCMTLTAELEKRTFEMRCYRRLLNISYKDHVTNEDVRRKIQAAIGMYDELLTLVKKRKLRWCNFCETLKVASCPNDNDSVLFFFFVCFCVVFEYCYFLNLLLPRKPQDFAENSRFFVCLFLLCWNSDSKNSFVTCP